MTARAYCLGALLIGTSLGVAEAAQAQSMTPMKAFIQSQQDDFTVKIRVANPYPDAQRSEIIVRDMDLRPIEDAVITANNFVLAAGQRRAVSVQIGFIPEKRTRIVYVCHTIRPRLSGVGTSYKGEVCGKFSAFRS